MSKPPVPSPELQGDDRRQDFRADMPICVSVDMPLALSCEALPPRHGVNVSWQWDDLAVSPDLVKSMVTQTDLLTQEPLLLQMLTRIDWMLTTVMKTLGKNSPVQQGFPEFLMANMSASGIRFLTRQEFPTESEVMLRMVLRPFVPIQALAKVLRVRPMKVEGETRFETACEFSEIGSDDREAIIRHVFRAQASLQRQRLTHQEAFVT
ncbi:PilZ domain-containing protein [Candidatus Nitronereus thalassa]|uniref:PilZ domain-containing protein n=1 Tax=Candidatus Nitronereus thalassa TaxID=3020898 RepID=A0ABU3K624_9BACT|nr:PilZ domain-containing protein [Candidatus Nitronereus thalassa]MDT7041831.1 PilZ domain-containing protein [Candidatus Nitronereus thalassa]